MYLDILSAISLFASAFELVAARAKSDLSCFTTAELLVLGTDGEPLDADAVASVRIDVARAARSMAESSGC